GGVADEKVDKGIDPDAPYPAIEPSRLGCVAEPRHDAPSGETKQRERWSVAHHGRVVGDKDVRGPEPPRVPQQPRARPDHVRQHTSQHDRVPRFLTESMQIKTGRPRSPELLRKRDDA